MESFRNSFFKQEPLVASSKGTSYRFHNFKVLKGCKVLVADKDLKESKKIKKFLNSRGYSTQLVDRWRYIMAEIKRTDISVLFLDVKLLDIKGYKLIPIIKRVRPDISIIITNDTNSIEVESLIRNYSIFFYCLKPYDMEEIYLIVENALGNILKH